MYWGRLNPNVYHVIKDVWGGHYPDHKKIKNETLSKQEEGEGGAKGTPEVLSSGKHSITPLHPPFILFIPKRIISLIPFHFLFSPTFHLYTLPEATGGVILPKKFHQCTQVIHAKYQWTRAFFPMSEYKSNKIQYYAYYFYQEVL